VAARSWDMGSKRRGRSSVALTAPGRVESRLLSITFEFRK
jgi:hypothetical protein